MYSSVFSNSVWCSNGASSRRFRYSVSELKKGKESAPRVILRPFYWVFKVNFDKFETFLSKIVRDIVFKIFNLNNFKLLNNFNSIWRKHSLKYSYLYLHIKIVNNQFHYQVLLNNYFKTKCSGNEKSLRSPVVQICETVQLTDEPFISC